MTSLAEIYGAVNNVTLAINNLASKLQVFNLGPTSSAVPGTAGTITFSSSQPTGFLLVTTSSGAVVKVPYYSNP